jgi:hypothetical protein
VRLPPRGYANLSIREDVRKMLDELRAETGIHDLSDLLVVLVRTYRDYTNAISKIQELLTSSASKTLTSSASKVVATGGVTSTTNPPVTQSKAKSEEKERIKIISLEWARKQGVNVEEYMAKKERQGYVCNETGREIVCVWREDLEQLIVELNSAGAKMGEFEKVLSGEKLNIARVAERAGLLWYDNKEKRWKAPL